jgi:uncharacterized membrane protein YeaQ/YmgE (transglycosylase-associated protein family)
MFMNLVCWLAVGLVAGLVAGKFVNQRDDDPKLALALAAVGAAVCGFLYAHFSATGVNAFNAGSLWGALAGGALVLAGWHVSRGLASRT